MHKKIGAMKRYVLTILFSIVLSTVLAGNASNLWLDYSRHGLSAQQAVLQCTSAYNLPESSDLILTRTVVDNIGMTHYTYQQYIDGIKVEGCYLLVHSKKGIVSTINGRILEAANSPTERSYMPLRQVRVKNNLPIENNLEPLIFEHKGVYRSAYKYFDDERYSNVYVDAKTGDEIVVIPTMTNGDMQGTAKTIFNGTQNITCNLANSTYTLVDNARNIHTVDATQYTGSNSTLYDWVNNSTTWSKPILTSVTIEWAAQDWWYNSVTDPKPDFYIQITSGGTVLYTSGYYNDTDLPVTFYVFPNIVEADGNLKIEVLDYDQLGDDSAGKVSITRTTAGTYSWNNSKTRASYTLINNPAHDAHWGMEKVYDFYLNKFNHKSYDGNGAQILQLVNPPSTICSANNAAAKWGGGIYFMAYGIGDGKTTNPHAMLDVMGHEFTHLVTAANGDQNLPTSGEGGALNESFGDIMGNAIEAYALGATDWVFSKGLYIADATKYTRNLKNPKDNNVSYPGPTTYNGENWRTITGQPNNTPIDQGGNDNDWVHINCGVQNYWFYLLCQGGSGYIDGKQANGSYSVTGIGVDKAVQIVYRNLLKYITSTSKYIDSRKGSIQAAIDLYGKGSQEHQSVVNAWYAVGVGEPYIEEPDNYVIVAKRDAASNWYYMTSDLGTASTKRYQAVDAGTPSLANVNTINLDSKYYWTIEENKLKTAAGYSAWTAGNSATIDNIGKDLSIENQTDGTYIFSFEDGENTRRLALNKDSRNNYFAYYKGQDQIYKLTLIIKEGETWRPEGIEPVSNKPRATKLLRNNQILILRGDRAYTLTGQEVK